MTEERAATLTRGPDETHRLLAEVLADVLGVERVPGDAHFFDDLGADSMVMARFCARVRKRPDLADVSMKDVYRHPTVAALAATVAEPAPAPARPPSVSAVPATDGEATTGAAGVVQYVLCGTIQLLFLLGSSCVAALLVVWSFAWVTAGTGLLDMYGRAVAFSAASLVGTSTLPILAKWLLVGRWRPCRIRVWSPAYIRFWIVRTLIRSNPLLVVAGARSRTSGSSLLHVLYLRALGARIGRNVAVFSRNVPVCTDLITIGDGSVIRKDTFFSGYRARDGVIYTGRVTLGANVVVGEATVLDIGTAMGDGARLAHASSLQTGQAVPVGEHWHGSPACRADIDDVDDAAVDPVRCSTARRVTHAVVQVLTALLVYLPLGIGGTSVVLADFPMLAGLLDTSSTAFMTATFYRDGLAASAVVFVGGLFVAFLGATAVPRLLALAIRADRVYSLYGFHYAVHRVIGRLTNVRFFTTLFGDSSYVVHYLRMLGYDLSTVEQTGSNFGTEVRHETPFHVTVGRGTMVADGLSLMNADFSNSSFRVSRTSIGAHSFLGNNIVYPPRSRTGDNCLLATKTLVPVDGPVRRDVGLLGSPSFEIPRTVDRDAALDPGEGLRRRLAGKNRHNLGSMGVFLLVRWVHVFGLTLLVMGAADCFRLFGPAAVAVELVAMAVFTMAWFVLVERAATGFRALRPRTCSIYDTYFWWHERYWKLAIPRLDLALAGTPFKNVVSRLLGVRLGRRVFDDGCSWPERTLVTVGDRCTLNAGSVVQCHSQEDGAFKSDRTLIGGRATLGVNAFVHYGVVIGDRAEIATDSFVMKGSEIPVGAVWTGNPAVETSTAACPATIARRSGTRAPTCWPTHRSVPETPVVRRRRRNAENQGIP